MRSPRRAAAVDIPGRLRGRWEALFDADGCVSELRRADAPLQRLQLTFAQPAYLGQTLRLVLQGDQLEMLDEAGQALVFGSAQD